MLVQVQCRPADPAAGCCEAEQTWRKQGCDANSRASRASGSCCAPAIQVCLLSMPNALQEQQATVDAAEEATRQYQSQIAQLHQEYQARHAQRVPAIAQVRGRTRA